MCICVYVYIYIYIYNTTYNDPTHDIDMPGYGTVYGTRAMAFDIPCRAS